MKQDEGPVVTVSDDPAPRLFGPRVRRDEERDHSQYGLVTVALSRSYLAGVVRGKWDAVPSLDVEVWAHVDSRSAQPARYAQPEFNRFVAIGQIDLNDILTPEETEPGPPLRTSYDEVHDVADDPLCAVFFYSDDVFLLTGVDCSVAGLRRPQVQPRSWTWDTCRRSTRCPKSLIAEPVAGLQDGRYGTRRRDLRGKGDPFSHTRWDF